MVPVVFITTPLSSGAVRLASTGPRGPGGRLLADVVTMTPNAGDLPGGDVLQKLMNGLDGWALALALVGLVVGAAAWALGSHGQNYQQSFVGRRAVLISGLAALLIGAGPGIVNFFFNTGAGVHSP
ncbi:MAG TPA: DUF6112 family protein [Acidimicrobiales bacterium]|jgi:hypothetical protein|nr:DUF6112 family protein [Acidimicrobiales bacterium]